MNPVFLFTFHLKAGSTTLILQAKIMVTGRWKKNNTFVGTQKWNCFAQPRLIRDKSFTKR